MSPWSTFLWTWLQEHHHPAVCHSLSFRLVVRVLQYFDQGRYHASAIQFPSLPIWKRSLDLRESTLRSTNELLWHLQNSWFGSAQRGVGMWTSLLLGRSLQCILGKRQWVNPDPKCFLAVLKFVNSSNLAILDLELLGKLDVVKFLD